MLLKEEDTVRFVMFRSRRDGEVTIHLVLRVQKTQNGGQQLVLNFEQNSDTQDHTR